MRARNFSVGKTRVAVAIAAVSLAIGLGAAAAPKAGPAQAGLSRVRFGGDQTSTRIVIELSRATHAKLVSEGQPVVLDLAKIDVGSERQGVGQGLVKAWTAEGGGGSARLKLALNRPARIERRFMLAPSDGAPTYRYVLDLRADGPTDPAANTPSAIIAAAAPKLIPAKAEAKPLNLKKVIVVDAGHGGHDPGALGASVQEKAVTLAAAKALKSKLESTGRYKVVLTRDSDTFIPLDSRVEIARRAGADLFISLHADAGASTATRGASVYTLSDKGSERVQRTMASGQGGLMRVSQPGANLAVSQILLDLTQRATRNKSTSFAERLVDQISDVTPLLERSRRDAAYRVLLAPDVPAVLLEMGFITNPSDEAFLSSQNRRQKLTDAVAAAIDGYFSEETKLAADRDEPDVTTKPLGAARGLRTALDLVRRAEKRGLGCRNERKGIRPSRSGGNRKSRSASVSRSGRSSAWSSSPWPASASASIRPGCSTTCLTHRNWSTTTRPPPPASMPGTAS